MALRKVTEILPNVADQTVQLVCDNGREIDVKVEMCKVVLDPTTDRVYLYDNSTSNTVTASSANEPNYYSLFWDDISDPVTTSSEELRDALVAMLQFIASGGGGGGSATSANQLLQIAQATEDAFSGSVWKWNNNYYSVFKDVSSDVGVFTDNLHGSDSVFKKSNGSGVFVDFDNDESWFKQIWQVGRDTYDRFTDPNNGESVFLTVFDTSVFKNASGDSAFTNGSETIAEIETAIREFQSRGGASVFKTDNDDSVFVDPLTGESNFYDSENGRPYLNELVELTYEINSAMTTVLNASQIFIARPESANVITAPAIGPFVDLADLITAINTYRGTGDFFELSCQIIYVSAVIGYYAVITYSYI